MRIALERFNGDDDLCLCRQYHAYLLSELIHVVGFAFGDTRRMRLMQAVYFIFAMASLNKYPVVDVQFSGILLFLFFCHNPFQFTNLASRDCMKFTYGCQCFFTALGMFAVVCRSEQVFAGLCVCLTLINTFIFGYLVASVNHLLVQSGIGRECGVVSLNGCI